MLSLRIRADADGLRDGGNLQEPFGPGDEKPHVAVCRIRIRREPAHMNRSGTAVVQFKKRGTVVAEIAELREPRVGDVGSQRAPDLVTAEIPREVDVMDGEVVQNAAILCAVKHPSWTAFRTEPVRPGQKLLNNVADFAAGNTLLCSENGGVIPFGQHQKQRRAGRSRRGNGVQVSKGCRHRLVSHNTDPGRKRTGNVRRLGVVDSGRQKNICTGVQQSVKVRIAGGAECIRGLRGTSRFIRIEKTGDGNTVYTERILEKTEPMRMRQTGHCNPNWFGQNHGQ